MGLLRAGIFSELIKKRRETIESHSQQDLLYMNLENCAEARRSNPVMRVLAEVTEVAVALAEMQTPTGKPPHGCRQCVGNPAGHVAKKVTVETGEDGVRASRPQVVDDNENTVYEDRTPDLTSDDVMGRIEPRQQSWSEAKGSRTVIDQEQ